MRKGLFNSIKNLFARKRKVEAPAEPLTPSPSQGEGRGEGENSTITATPDSPASVPAQPHRHGLPRLLHIAKEVLVRVYAFGVLLLVSWAGYLAVSYLVWTVFVPLPVPQRLLEWQGRSDVAALRTAHAPGTSESAERAPLAHYHRVEKWFQPDPRNGCTFSGCHDPLPHSKEMKIPAFTNFHATFISCQLCHVNGPTSNDAITWINIADGSAQEPPALLRLMKHMETSQDQIRDNPFEAHTTIAALLRSALTVSGQEPTLSHLLLELETSEPGSPVWRRAADQLSRELPTHVRGEYGAKIAREAAPGAYRERSRELAQLAKQYLALPPGDSQRTALKDRIHQPLAKEPLTCLSCHGDKPATVDFEALGYSPSRAKTLGRLELANLMQQIRQGKQFFIPSLLGGAEPKK